MQVLAQETARQRLRAVGGAEAGPSGHHWNTSRKGKAFGRAVADFQNTRFKLPRCVHTIDVRSVVDRCVMDHNEKADCRSVAAGGQIVTYRAAGPGVVDEGVAVARWCGLYVGIPICRMYAQCAYSAGFFAGTSRIMKGGERKGDYQSWV